MTYNSEGGVGSLDYNPQTLYYSIVGEPVSFRLNNDTVVVHGIVQNIRDFGVSRRTIFGTITTGGLFVLSCSHDAVVGDLELSGPGKKYEIRQLNLTSYSLKEYDSKSTHDNDAIGSSSLLTHKDTPTTKITAILPPIDTKGILDVAVIYTPNALASLGGSLNAMEAQVHL